MSDADHTVGNDSGETALSTDMKAQLAAALGASTPHTAASEDDGKSEKRKDDVGSILARIIEDATGLPLEEITNDSRIDDDLNVDSLSKIDIAVQAEDRFGVRIEEEELSGSQTVGDVVKLIESRRKTS